MLCQLKKNPIFSLFSNTVSPYDAHNLTKICFVTAIRKTSRTHEIHVRTIHNKKQGIKISINQEYTLSVILELSLHLNF